MAKGETRLVYWESSPFISWQIGCVDRPEDERAGITQTASAVQSGQIRLLTSSLVHMEVCELKATKEAHEMFTRLLDRPGVTVESIDARIARRAASILAFWRSEPGRGEMKEKKYAIDALHLATALEGGADELHTFDAGLLGTNGKSCAPGIKIQKPPGQPEFPYEALAAAITKPGEPQTTGPSKGAAPQSKEESTTPAAAPTTTATPTRAEEPRHATVAPAPGAIAASPPTPAPQVEPPRAQ